jgi:hypothetical protein
MDLPWGKEASLFWEEVAISIRVFKDVKKLFAI